MIEFLSRIQDGGEAGRGAIASETGRSPAQAEKSIVQAEFVDADDVPGRADAGVGEVGDGN